MKKANKSIGLNEEGLRIEVNEEFFPNFKGSIIPITIGEHSFKVVLSGEELDKKFKEFELISDFDDATIEGIAALEKLAKMLRISLDVSFSNNTILK